MGSTDSRKIVQWFITLLKTSILPGKKRKLELTELTF